MQSLHVPASTQSDEVEQVSPQAAAVTFSMNSGLLSSAQRCWQVLSMQILQVPASTQSDEVEQASPHMAAATGLKI